MGKICWVPSRQMANLCPCCILRAYDGNSWRPTTLSNVKLATCHRISTDRTSLHPLMNLTKMDTRLCGFRKQNAQDLELHRQTIKDNMSCLTQFIRFARMLVGSETPCTSNTSWTTTELASCNLPQTANLQSPLTAANWPKPKAPEQLASAIAWQSTMRWFETMLTGPCVSLHETWRARFTLGGRLVL